MTVDNLEEAKESEKQTQYFTELPDPFLFVKAQLIMDVGNEDIPRVDEVRTTIKDIWDIRQSKLRYGSFWRKILKISWSWMQIQFHVKIYNFQ